MTTVAFDGISLAADSLHTWNGCRDLHEPKAWRVRGLIVAGAGPTSLILRFRQWVAEGMEDESPLFDEEDGAGLVIPPTGPGACFGSKGAWPVRGPYAIGSGEPFARAAMACGKTAEQAVRIAAQFDTSTGGLITVLHLRAPERPWPRLAVPPPAKDIADLRDRLGLHMQRSEAAAYG